MIEADVMIISHRIGRGGFGAVFGGKFKDKDSAYKVLTPDENGKITSRDRKVMQNEIVLLELMNKLRDSHEHVRGCDHPSHHVVEILGKYEPSSIFSKIGSIFSSRESFKSPSVKIEGQQVPDNIGIVLKYFNGVCLSDHLERGDLTFEDIWLIIHQLVDTLKYFKDNHFLHLDIKPDNILYKLATARKEGKLGKVKIIDLGLSVDASKTEGMHIPEYGHSYLQTDFYRHPMADLGCWVDWRADAWSLGCMIFELITEKPLFSFTNIKRLHFLHEVERLNGPIPQDWFERGTAQGEYYVLKGDRYVLRSIFNTQNNSDKNYRKVRIIDPMIDAARKSGYPEGKVRSLADMVIGLVSYYPCPYEIYSQAHLQNSGKCYGGF